MIYYTKNRQTTNTHKGPPFTNLSKPRLPPSLHSSQHSFPRLPSLAPPTSPNTPLLPHRILPRTLPLRRNQLLLRLSAQLPPSQSLPLGLLAQLLRLGHHKCCRPSECTNADLLCGVSGSEFVEGELCVHGVHLWDLPGVRRCPHG